MFALTRAMEAKNFYTQGHTERVTRYALALGQRVGLADTQQLVLQRGPTLHHIGKIPVPDKILKKLASLTPDEFAIVKQHPTAGVHIVEPLLSLREALPLIRWHHERMDGKGYPDGLHGDDVPLLARILAVSDVFDALASARPYRGLMPVLDCLDILRHNAAGGGLDPMLVERFCAVPAIPLLEKTQGKATLESFLTATA